MSYYTLLLSVPWRAKVPTDPVWWALYSRPPLYPASQLAIEGHRTGSQKLLRVETVPPQRLSAAFQKVGCETFTSSPLPPFPVLSTNQLADILDFGYMPRVSLSRISIPRERSFLFFVHCCLPGTERAAGHRRVFSKHLWSGGILLRNLHSMSLTCCPPHPLSVGPAAM